MSEKPYNVPTPGEFFNWLSQFTQPALETATKATAQSPVAPLVDPLAMWKSMTQYNEQAWSQFFKTMVGTPEFAAGMGRTASNTSVVRDTVRKAAKAYLEAANMPSRDDLVHLAEQIVALDGKVDDVEDILRDADLSQLYRRLDAIMLRLDSLERQNREAEMARSEALESKLAELDAKLAGLTALGKQFEQIQQALTRISGSGTHPAAEESAVNPPASVPANPPKISKRPTAAVRKKAPA